MYNVDLISLRKAVDEVFTGSAPVIATKMVDGRVYVAVPEAGQTPQQALSGVLAKEYGERADFCPVQTYVMVVSPDSSAPNGRKPSVSGGWPQRQAF